MTLRNKLIWRVLPTFLLLLVYEIWLTEAFMRSVRIEEIPFGLSETARSEDSKLASSSGIRAKSVSEGSRSFFHLFNVPYIICFFAAKGKWPFVPPMMQTRVDAAAKTIFSHNDSYIRQFCQKWVQIKECFRPLFGKELIVSVGTTTDPDVEVLDAKRKAKGCRCETTESPMVYFDKNYIGNVSSETILNTIEFLESFLPAPTKKPKRKNNRVRSRVDEMDIKE